jgi:hypothetical protein
VVNRNGQYHGAGAVLTKKAVAGSINYPFRVIKEVVFLWVANGINEPFLQHILKHVLGGGNEVTVHFGGGAPLRV